LFERQQKLSQKVDIFALGITFYRIITYRYPLMKYSLIQFIERPIQIKDDILWNLLSLMLEFDPDKRITASQALQHPFFTSPEAIDGISPEQHHLALQSAQAELDGNSNITEFDKNPSFIVSYSIINEYIQSDIQRNPPQEQSELEDDTEQITLFFFIVIFICFNSYLFNIDSI
ncbi:MAG: hypothetical protein EZS28_024991, partial [Streblomastix strix]